MKKDLFSTKTLFFSYFINFALKLIRFQKILFLGVGESISIYEKKNSLFYFIIYGPTIHYIISIIFFHFLLLYGYILNLISSPINLFLWDGESMHLSVYETFLSSFRKKSESEYLVREGQNVIL